MRVLLVEEDCHLGQTIQAALESTTCGVDWVRNETSAIHAIETLDFGLILLDIGRSFMNGVAILQLIRSVGYTNPILVLMAGDQLSQKVEVLDSGADDIMSKPFHFDELLARLRALMRRNESRLTSIFRSGSVELNQRTRQVRVSGKPVLLTLKEYRLVKLLMEHAGGYVTKSEIEYTLYSAEQAVESNTTEVLIYNLRKKLGHGFIKSIRGVGYIVEK
ncbi:MAG: response regulator [Brucella intermedia]